MGLLRDFLNLIDSMKIWREEENQISRTPTKIKILRWSLFIVLHMGVPVSFLARVFGGLKHPFFFFPFLHRLLLWGNFLGWINLRCRNMVVVGWCCMCKMDGESVDHLLLHCLCKRLLVSCVLSLWSTVGYASKGDWIVGTLGGAFGRHRNGYIWNAIPLYVLWTIWRECKYLKELNELQ